MIQCRSGLRFALHLGAPAILRVTFRLLRASHNGSKAQNLLATSQRRRYSQAVPKCSTRLGPNPIVRTTVQIVCWGKGRNKMSASRAITEGCAVIEASVLNGALQHPFGSSLGELRDDSIGSRRTLFLCFLHNLILYQRLIVGDELGGREW